MGCPHDAVKIVDQTSMWQAWFASNARYRLHRVPAADHGTSKDLSTSGRDCILSIVLEATDFEFSRY